MLAVDGLVRDTGDALIEVQRNAALRAIASEQLERIREISALVDKRFAKGRPPAPTRFRHSRASPPPRPR
ncbi:hypothetical protein P0F65_22085 [Sphingomonas sp. I4]